jgi:protein SCO1/2
MPAGALWRRSLLAACLLISLFLATGCGQPDTRPTFKLTDLTGAGFGKELNLLDHNGKPRTLADFRGKVVVIFFGFAQCPDVCPTTLAELAAVTKELGRDAERMQVLFVTVDPERDSPEVLRQYLPSFDPRFLGLYGDAEATARAAKEFRIFYQKQAQKDSKAYSVDHSAGTYILDREGRLRLYARYGAGAQLLLHDIRILLGS